jgi:outer membrane lipoprotein SlyB
MKNLYIVVVLIFALSVTGCSTMSAKNTQFTYQKKDSNKPSMTVMLCRPR